MLSALPAHAQLSTRTWVSGVGDDFNICSRTAPCKTFAGAIAKTAVGGEISVLDPGGYGPVTITKSITINGTAGQGYGSIVTPAGVSAININLVDPADTRRTVRLNWLDLNGLSVGIMGIRVLNGTLAGASIVIENTTIDGFTQRGISDERINGGKLVVANTVVRHTQLSGIQISGNGSNEIDATISNVRVHNSAVAGLTANGGSKVMIANSVFSGSTFGLDIEQANTSALAENVTLSGNGTGIFVGTGATLRLSNSSVAFNTTGVNGTVQSFSNNRFVGNGAGGTITPIGSPGDATGLQ
jgi:hypothetical protein